MGSGGYINCTEAICNCTEAACNCTQTACSNLYHALWQELAQSEGVRPGSYLQ